MTKRRNMLVYLSHPFTGDETRNRERAGRTGKSTSVFTATRQFTRQCRRGREYTGEY